MASFIKLQDLAHSTLLAAQKTPSGLDAVHMGIYDLVVHAFTSEVLTLGRMTIVVQSVYKGIADSANQDPSADVSFNGLSQREAYRGLCAAATEGLTAAGLAYAELRKFSGKSLPLEFDNALSKVALDYGQQLGQINIGAAWFSDSRIVRLQTELFDQLLRIDEQDSKREKLTAVPWARKFFLSCGYEGENVKGDIESNLMLLGLITSGILVGLLTAQRVV
jgi:hypothetical protein